MSLPNSFSVTPITSKLRSFAKSDLVRSLGSTTPPDLVQGLIMKSVSTSPRQGRNKTRAFLILFVKWNVNASS